MNTPREDGLRMPAEWAPHQATLMEWPRQIPVGMTLDPIRP